MIESVRSYGHLPWLEGHIWQPLYHLDSTDYAGYLLKWGKVCKISAAFVDNIFPNFAGYYQFANLPEDHIVWILEAEGPNVRIGGNFMGSPKWIWSKFVEIEVHWMQPRTNVFFHEHEPEFEEVPVAREEEE